MDKRKRVKKINPASNTNLLSHLFFWYTREIFCKSNRRNITLDDMYDPVETDASQYLGNKLEKEWNYELSKRKKLEPSVNNEEKKILPKLAKPSLLKALIRMFFWQNIILSIIQAVNFLILIVFYPIFQGWLIDYFKMGMNEKSGERHRAFLNATIIIFMKLVTVFFQQHSYRQALLMGMRARVACCTLIYRKTLRLNKSVLDQTTVGQVINLMSNDVSRFDTFFQFLNFMWITPIQIILIVYIMWDTIGIILLVGISILLIIAIPLQLIVSHTSKIFRTKIAILTDKRIQLISELVSGIQVIKMYAWENPFEKIINHTRLAEMKNITITSHVRSIFFSSMIYTERITLFGTLILFIFMDNKLTAEISFVLATYFNILQLSIIYMMPNGLIATGEVSVSIKRIEEFLLLDEITTKIFKNLSSNKILLTKNIEDNMSADSQYSYAPVEVIEVCALHRDFEQLPKGDLTIVGERGSSLSGGQRARINLARAVYRRADLYLLDDPLSAVDSRVARHLFERCVRDFLHAKTRILVTHQLQFLEHTDSVVFIERGRIKYYGSYKNISNLNPEIMDMIDKYKSDEDRKNFTDVSASDPIDAIGNAEEMNITSDQSSIKACDISENDSILTSINGEEVSRIYRNISLFKTYLRAGASWCLLTFYVIVLVLTQIATSGTDYWLGYWTNIEDIRSNIKNTSDPLMRDTKYNLVLNNSEFNIDIDENNLLSTKISIYIYAIILAICIVFSIIRSYLIIRICMKASQQLHKLMFSNLLHSPINFFNKNPSGRIMNRFSKDTGAMDELLSKNYMEAIQIFSVMIGILVLIIIVNYWMIIAILIVLILFLFAKKIYLNTVQKIKRLETATKSPVFSHVNASLNGLTTIRSCGNKIEDRLIMEFDRYQDEHSSASYLIIVTAAAFGMILDFLLIILNAIIAYSFILLNSENILAGNVGLALSQSSILTGMVQHGFHLFVEVMSQLTSVEKIIQYTNLPKEYPLVSGFPLPKNWPQCGRIVMKNVSMRYEKNQPFVLKNLNIVIDPGWKVGIVGRTGSGKSSIITALFRLTGENLKGEIIIDGIDTSYIDLQDLRSCISIIPQEPVLFFQSLRYNLDPMGQYEDCILREALREVKLNNLSLDQQVAEKGSNFSVGQRQLICLARAIIRKNLILVLDEATANIDARTDAIIQSTIRKRFANCTVLTVAHRLNTIIDSDRIIVMDNGSIVEFGCPHELLNNKMYGHFLHMVNQTGKMMSEKLGKVSKQSCLQNMQCSFDIPEDLVNNVRLAVQSEENYSIRL